MSGCKDSTLLTEVRQMNNEQWENIKQENYCKNVVCLTEDGAIDFSPISYKQVEYNGIHVTYDEYLDIIRNTGNDVRQYFAMCFYSGGGYANCRGVIERIDNAKNKIVFKQIHVNGMYGDGMCFDGKEDHVWMDRSGFEDYSVDDCLHFSAEVYRYLKTGSGKKIDYALRDPIFVEKIDSYELPTEDDLLLQSIDRLICESCVYAEQCYGEPCLANSECREEMRSALFAMLKREDRVQSE